MNDLVTIITTGRVTADLELKTSQNGKNTKYVQFGLAVNKGYGENEHTNFYSCVAYGEAAQRMVDAKVKKALRDGWRRSSYTAGTMVPLTARRTTALTEMMFLLMTVASCLQKTADRMDYRLIDGYQ